MNKRRRFLAAGATLAGAAYINHRGLRYPRLSFEPRQASHSIEKNGFVYQADGLIHTSANLSPVDEIRTQFRAINLEPRLTVHANQKGITQIEVSNVSSQALLKVDGSGIEINENKNGITRELTINHQSNRTISLEWYLPERDGAKFAIIGDSGAGDELEWCYQRAHQLGAQFMLHLGDFNYVDGEYERAIEIFNTEAIPTFVSIGNHDFNDSGLVYQDFLNRIGPLNHAFSFAGTQFLNIDTAADFFPAYSGLRGQFLDQVEAEQAKHFDRVCFTHRNFVDPRQGKNHTIGGLGEKKWLANRLADCGVNRILTGHVHKSAETEYRDLQQYTVGEGLGYEDIIHKSQVAKILIGTVEMGQRVRYDWHALNMPMKLHTSQHHVWNLQREGRQELLEWLINLLNKPRLTN